MGAGSIQLATDKPQDSSYLFSLANVNEGGFSYSGSSLKTRHSVVSVSYYNMDSQDIDFEVVEDSNLISKIGTVVKQVKAFACTSRGQAARLGKAILFAENFESEIVTFNTSIDSGAVVVREVSKSMTGSRGCKKIRPSFAAASTTQMTVDDTGATDLSTENNPIFSVILPDGSVEANLLVQYQMAL